MARALLIVGFLIGLGLTSVDALELQPAPFVYNLIPVPGERDTFVVKDTGGLQIIGGTLLSGDRVTKLGETWSSRVAAYTAIVRDDRTGSTLTLRDAHSREGYVATHLPIKIVDLLLEIFALALLVARGNRLDVRWLSIAVFLTAFAFPFARDLALPIVIPWLYQQVVGVLQTVAVLALVELAATVSPRARWIDGTRSICRILTFVSSVFDVIRHGLIDYSGYQLAGFHFFMNQIPAAMLVAAIIIFTASIRSAPRVERRRLAILALSTIAGNAVIIVAAFSPTQVFDNGQTWISYAGLIAMSAGLGYGVLVEHMFDIGFVVNRAVVYALTSGCVVLAFMAIEWLVGKVATNIGHLGSSVVELALAIGVGLGLRPIHERVDAIVDTVFFAARHRAANAILRFSDECSEAHSVDALVTLALERLEAFARPERCAIYLTNDEGNFAATRVTEGFPSILLADSATSIRLRASRTIVEKIDLPMLDFADYAFPMTRRGGLAGAIFIKLGSKTEPYSPEEQDAIATLARSLGAVIVALEASALKRLIAENDALREQLRKTAVLTEL